VSQPGCNHLDDYLAEALAGPDQAAFAEHLAECPQCQRAVQEQPRLDALLGRALAAPIPAGLIDRVEKRLRSERRRRTGRVLGLAAAVAFCCLAAGWLLRSRPAPVKPVPEPPIAENDRPAPVEVPAPVSRPYVGVQAGSGMVAVRVKSQNPTVTIIWVLPAHRNAGRDPGSRLERSRS
jgi:anti-sigma factor RsiW